MYFCVLINLSTHRLVFNKNGLLYFTPCIYSIFIFTIMSSFHLYCSKWAYKDLQLLLQDVGMVDVCVSILSPDITVN